MVKPSLPHHGPIIAGTIWHRSFHPPNPWYKEYRTAPVKCFNRFGEVNPFFLAGRIFLWQSNRFCIFSMRFAAKEGSVLNESSGCKNR
ncbi:hypothetical protein CEE69_08895 [Rhodopirellula bahusiensis]|uniref:Uncharacterized protein n=1 Tax=Rhodopirellula bahusiensis TaxID=2014065 RepID=A0A2G1W9N4_9BACT|nr:hypothetical protein CEE69_08895 [Rhodopirellula bahusiensis]